MKILTFVDTTTGIEYQKMVSDRTMSSKELFDNKVKVLQTGVATTAITNEWRKVHEYSHTGTVSDVWKDPGDIKKWEDEVNERAKYIKLKEE